MATMYVLVGLPGAGKTTEAIRLAAEHRALRLTPDEWLLPLFGIEDDPVRRDILEGRMVTTALEVLRLGTSAVLDFGCWSRDERAALRWLADQVSAACALVYLPVDTATQAGRIAQRWRESPAETYPVTETDLAWSRNTFEEPDADELVGRMTIAPPKEWSSWLAWAQDRWPSLTLPAPPTRSPRTP